MRRSGPSGLTRGEAEASPFRSRAALPRLETRRLVLRPLEAGDAPAMQRFAEDPGVSRMLTRVPHPYPPGEAEGFIAEFGASPFETLPVRPFAITVAGEFAGVVALSNENGFAAGPIVLGYWLGRPYWGRGYASEATREVIGSYAFGALGADELFAGAFADNPASLRVLEKLGFERVGTSELHSLARGRAAPHVDMKLARARFFAAGSP